MNYVYSTRSKPRKLASSAKENIRTKPRASEEVVKESNRHYYIIAGHSKQDTGAIANGYEEAELTIELRDLIVEELRAFTSSVSNDDDFKSLREVVNWLHEKTREDDIILDIHFNASDNAHASGTEVFIPDKFKENEATLGTLLSKRISDCLAIKDRGCKKESESARKKLAMMSPIGTNLLLEVCFLTNKKDMEKYVSLKNEVAKAIADCIK